MKRLLVALALLTASSQSRATDIPFGGDTLPYLVRTSDVVVRGDVAPSPSAGFTAAEERYFFYAVAGESTLKGAFLGREPVGFAVLAALPLRPGSGGDALVFLKRLSGPTAAKLALPADSSYVAVSGGYGVIDLAPPGRLAAINRYMSARGQAGLRSWAGAYVTSPDQFIQRSVLQLLFENATEPWAGALLANAVRNPRVSLENRDFAVQGLVEGGTSANVRVLRSVAEDARNTEFLRASAVRAFLTLEKGGTQLKRWQQSRDSILARLAGSALEDVQ